VGGDPRKSKLSVPADTPLVSSQVSSFFYSLFGLQCARASCTLDLQPDVGDLHCGSLKKGWLCDVIISGALYSVYFKSAVFSPL